MKKTLRAIFKDRAFQVAFIFFLSGVFLRFYRLYDFMTFLGDQGRDAIIMRRILTLEHLPAIGAPTSIGMVYLGPFYYYFIAPWLLLANFNPIGPAIGVAIFSSLFILLIFIAIKDITENNIAAIAGAGLVTFSSTLVEFSRFSWNPNLLPYFAFLAVFFLIKAQKTGKFLYYILAGACLSFAIQLHYLALFLGPVLALHLLTILFQQRSQIKDSLLRFFSFCTSFAFFSLPLLIFDLRHNFLNSKNFLALYQKGEAVSGDKLSSLINSFSTFNLYIFNYRLSPIISTTLLTIIIITTLLLFKKRDQMAWVFLAFCALLVGVSLYSGPKYPHYFAALYVLYFVIVASFIRFITSAKLQALTATTLLLGFLFINFKGYYFLYNSPSHQIQKAQNVAKVILDNVKVDKYQLTGLPNKYSDSSFRYYLELWGRRSLEHDTLEKADELFVLCETECKIIGDPQWEIAFFAPKKIVGKWNTEGLWIYKLTK